jgi:hypothetical protein
VARWPQPLDVGTPLHAGQTHIGADGARTLILVTQELNGPTCWVRAIDAERGQMVWQRQLGLVSQAQPVSAAGAVMCTDAAGVFCISATDLVPARSWQTAGARIEATGAATGTWCAARGSKFVHLSWDAGLVLRVTLVDAKGVTATTTHPLPALPQGTPALGRDFVLLPLANGIVVRVPLGEGAPTSGPEWRGLGVDETQPGHIVALGNDEFAITDGGRAVARFNWSDAKTWDKRGEAELAHRITAAPALLGNRLLVADASGTVTVLEGERLTPGRRWTFRSQITAGPFARGQGVGLIVGRIRLVWLDPGKDEPAWEYTFVAPVVGQPEVVDGVLVAADLQGGILAIDPATGNPVGPGYRLKTNQAAAAAPVPFGDREAFVLLMDGTALILPIDRLR